MPFGMISGIIQGIGQGAINYHNSQMDYITNMRNLALQENAYEYNKQWNQKTFDEDVRRYEEMKTREDNALQRMAEDAKSAGLNIASIAGSQGAAASGSTPTQAQMLQAPQQARPMPIQPIDIIGLMASASQIQKTQAETDSIKANTEGKKLENEILSDTKEWEKFEKEQNAKQAWRTGVGQELANRLASIIEIKQITKAQLENDILQLEKDIRNNQKDLSDKQKKQREILGILPEDSPEIQGAKLRKIYKNLKEYDGNTQDFIKAYAKEYNDRNTKNILTELANIVGGIPGATIKQIEKMVGGYGRDDLSDYDYTQW